MRVDDINYWMNEGRTILEEKLKFSRKNFGDAVNRPAKNLILFLGDGMGLTTITSARIYKGQKNGKGKAAERETLSWEQLPFTGLAKV